MSSAIYSHRRRSSSRCGGASVLLYTTHPKTNELCLILGRDAFGKHKWSDFGGGAKHEKDFRCAARELKEETHGIFPDITVDHLRTLAKVVFKFPHVTKRDTVMHYSTFLCRVPFPTEEDSLAAKFRAAFRKLPERMKKQVHVAEKAEIELVRVSDLDTTPLRSFFRMRMQYLLPLIHGPREPFGRKIVHLYTRPSNKKKNKKKDKAKEEKNGEEEAKEETSGDLGKFCSNEFSSVGDDQKLSTSPLASSPATASSLASSPASTLTAPTQPSSAKFKSTRGRRKFKYRGTNFSNRYKYKSKRIDWSRKVNCTPPPLPRMGSAAGGGGGGGRNRVRGDSRVWRAPRNANCVKTARGALTLPPELRDFPVSLTVV